MVWPQSMNWGNGARVDLRAFMKKKKSLEIAVHFVTENKRGLKREY